MNIQQYEEMIEFNTTKGYPNLMCGWPDEEYGITWPEYKNYCISAIEEMDEGDELPKLLRFEEWRFKMREENPDRGDLGFSSFECDLCGSLPGDRYALTAFNQELSDYVPLLVCGDCLLYIANGDAPDYVKE